MSLLTFRQRFLSKAKGNFATVLPAATATVVDFAGAPLDEGVLLSTASKNSSAFASQKEGVSAQATEAAGAFL